MEKHGKGFLAILISSFYLTQAASVQANERPLSSYELVQQARLKVEEGDLESAVRLYYRATKHEQPDPQAVSDLKSLLVDAQSREPEGSHSELFTAIEQEALETHH